MIALNGNLEKYCVDCPYLDLECFAHFLDGKTIYGCSHHAMCAYLFERFKQFSE